MKALKITFTIWLFLAGASLFGQINPINELSFQQSYENGNSWCPAYNCFVISWTLPQGSTDTLLGFNVYKNSVLWVYTEYTDVGCPGYTPCLFNDFYDDIPFWITVKAVYNSDSVVSIANDSIFVNDIAIGIEAIEKSEIRLLKNPISAGENVTLLFPDCYGEKCTLRVYAVNGQLIKEYQIGKLMKDAINFSSKGMTSGLYVIDIQLEEKIIKKKIVIE